MNEIDYHIERHLDDYWKGEGKIFLTEYTRIEKNLGRAQGALGVSVFHLLIALVYQYWF